MAIGFNPHYSEDVPLDGLTSAQFLALCVNTARTLGWDIRYISAAGLIALTTKALFKIKHRVIIRISGNLASLRSESTGGAMMDLGRNRKNIEQFTRVLAGGRTGYTTEQLAQTYEEIRARLKPTEQDILTASPGPATDNKASFLSLFIPRKGYSVTPVLIDLNLVIFVLMVVSGVNFLQPSAQNLIDWGANIRALTLDGQWWRLVTNFFVHIGFLHVVLNMYALLFIGVLLERQLGALRFSIAYLLTGIMASVTSLYWHPMVLSAGASGAIFGMYGVFLALLTTNLIDKTQRTALLSSIAVFIVYNLLNGTKGGIDNAAHVGGLLSGILIGYLFYPGLRHPEKPVFSYAALAFAALLVVVVTTAAFQKIPNDYPAFQRKIREFIILENHALRILRPADSVTGLELANRIRDTGIRNWKWSIRILQQAGQLEVSEPLKKETVALIRYCNLRIVSYTYIYKTLTGTAGHSGGDSTSYYNTQIRDLLDSLKMELGQ